MTALVDQISPTFAGITAAWASHDGAAVARHFAADATLVSPFGRRADGRAALAAMFTEYFEGAYRGSSIAFTIAHARAIEQDHAFVDGEQTVTGADGKALIVARLAALLRREGGAWRVVDGRPSIVATPPA
jgi:uncharacterized protein (TIGR02246 family)